MLDILKSLFVRHRDAAFRVPGAVKPDAAVIAVATADLADLVFHAPLLAALRRACPEAAIDLLVPESLESLAISSGFAREAIVYRPQQLAAWRPAYASLLRTLAKKRYDLGLMMSLQPQPLLETALLASGAAVRAGCGHRDAYPQLNLEVRPAEPVRGYYGNLPRHLAPYLGFAAGDLAPGWPITAERLRQAAQLVHFHKPSKDQLLVGIDSSLGKSGHGLTVESWQDVARQLAAAVSCRLLPLSAPGDLQRCQRFEAGLSGVPTGLTRDTVLDTILLLCQCDLFVAGNTELFHVAAAHGVPTLGLFFPADDPHWQPEPPAAARVLRVASAADLDPAAVVAAATAITGGRGGRAQATTRVVPPEPAAAPPAEG